MKALTSVTIPVLSLLSLVCVPGMTKGGDFAAQAQWFNAVSAWMKTASDHNVQTRMIEAQGNTQAKLIEAHAKLLTAQAGMVTAVASANKTNAEALKHMEETRTLQLDNSEKRAEVFYAKRAMYERNRDATRLRQSVPTNEDIYRRSKASTPERLSEEQFNASRKEIHWPSLL